MPLSVRCKREGKNGRSSLNGRCAGRWKSPSWREQERFLRRWQKFLRKYNQLGPRRGLNYCLSRWTEKSNQGMLTYKICDGTVGKRKRKPVTKKKWESRINSFPCFLAVSCHLGGCLDSKCVSGMGWGWAGAEGTRSTAPLLPGGDGAGDAVTAKPQPMEGVRGEGGWWLVRTMRKQRQRAQLDRGGERLWGEKAFSARAIVHGRAIEGFFSGQAKLLLSIRS